MCRGGAEVTYRGPVAGVVLWHFRMTSEVLRQAMRRTSCSSPGLTRRSPYPPLSVLVERASRKGV